MAETARAVILTALSFLLFLDSSSKILQKKNGVWICFMNFIQYHLKVDFTIFFFRSFRCIEVILNKWVMVFRWAFRQMSFIIFSTIDTVSSGSAGTGVNFTSTSTVVTRPRNLMFNPPLWSWLISSLFSNSLTTYKNIQKSKFAVILHTNHW